MFSATEQLRYLVTLAGMSSERTAKYYFFPTLTQHHAYHQQRSLTYHRPWGEGLGQSQYRGLVAPKTGIARLVLSKLQAIFSLQHLSEQAVRPFFRAPQLNPSPVKTENIDSNGDSDPILERLRELAAATRSVPLPSQAPPVPNVPVCHGRALGEFKNYAMNLQRYFDRYPDRYITNERKVTRALEHVTLNLVDKWKRRIRKKPSEQLTFCGFCTFLIHQLQNGAYPEMAKARYINSYQRPSQSVTDFCNWLQQL